MKIGVPSEQFPGERRVALVPASIAALKKAGFEVPIERGAGERAGFPDAAYRTKARSPRRAGRTSSPQMSCCRYASAISRDARRAGRHRHGRSARLARNGASIASRGVTAFALELIPRITRAQSMDVLSSMATIGGYKAVLLAANTLPRMFPLLTTAAGTITPAHVFIVGVGVAGLQAIATARKLGAVVEAYDVRPAVKEQVQSVGAKFVELPLETGQAEDKGGYAKAQDESFYQRQREMMARVVAVKRRRHHDGGRARQEGARARDRRDGARHGAGIGCRGSRRRARRQLRADARRRGRRRKRCHDSRPDEPALHRAVSREPDVCEEHHDVSAAPGEGRRGEVD